MANDKLAKVVKAIESSDLGSIKVILSGLVKLANDPMANIKDLQNIIKLDPPLAGKILSVANSAYYATQRRFNNIEQAVIWIGLEAVKEIALSQFACDIFTMNSKKHRIRSRLSLWRHSLVVAILAKLIYRRELGKPGGNAFTAGIIHDIGLIFEDQHLNGDFVTVLEEMDEYDGSIVDIEQKVLGFDHAGLAMTIANRWDFPSDIAFALAGHHGPDSTPSNFRMLTNVIFLCDNVSHDMGFGFYELSQEQVNENIKNSLELLQIDEHSLDLLSEDVNFELDNMLKNFSPF
ncbi:MAG: HDOD domain-containing protein [Deltaproteobacteria bacterium]|nr:HDOD domain-containing protein [Deltaproteobacteria bacterium]